MAGSTTTTGLAPTTHYDKAASVQGSQADLYNAGGGQYAMADPYSGPQYQPQFDKQYWITCLQDAERAEQVWRKRAREIIQIYRNEGRTGRGKNNSPGQITYNILYANTEVMLPAIYQKPPKPVVRSRFQAAMPPPEIPMPPPMGGGMPMPPGVLPPGGMPPGVPPGGPSPLEAAGGPLPPMLPPPAGGMPIGAGNAAPPMPGPMPAPQMGLPPAPPPMPMAGPPKANPADIETAAAVMEKALEVVLDNEANDEAIKLAIKDSLLPGRGVCRVRWKPQMKTFPVMAGDGVTGLPQGAEPGAPPVEEERKVWEEVSDEYVFWEDFLVDPVRFAPDTTWIAFRHLFDREMLEAEFAGSPEYEALKQAGKLESILLWTDESAAKNPVGGGSGMKATNYLGDYIHKAMIWEIWHRPTKRVVWFIKDGLGLILRIDPDVYQLNGFYPVPVPLLAVSTSDSRIPRPYFELYAQLAGDLDNISARISALINHIKARGAYNSASKDIQDLLLAGDNKMIPVDGVDMLNGGLANHIWMLPIELYVQALNQLYLARDQTKQAIYEIMGISDIMRGATKATETATAQRIKGSMGVSRLEDAKQQAENFCRDLLRLKGELIAQNFDPETLEAMTGETVTPEVLAILRSDFQRSARIDVESDSTVIPDLQAEQQGMAMVMQSVQLVMQGTQQMLASGFVPPQQGMQIGMELLKMALHPVPYSRGVMELLNNLTKQLAMLPPGMMMGPPPGPPPEGPPAGSNGKGPPGNNSAAKPPPVPQGMPPGMAPPPGIQ